MNNAAEILTPEQIKFQLVQIVDQLLLLKNQPVWEQLATTDLDRLLEETTTKADALWWLYRNLISSGCE